MPEPSPEQSANCNRASREPPLPTGIGYILFLHCLTSSLGEVTHIQRLKFKVYRRISSAFVRSCRRLWEPESLGIGEEHREHSSVLDPVAYSHAIGCFPNSRPANGAYVARSTRLERRNDDDVAEPPPICLERSCKLKEHCLGCVACFGFMNAASTLLIDTARPIVSMHNV